MHLVIIRHGQTVENAAGIIQGQGIGTLNEHGKQQAIAAAEQLRGDTFAAIYCSDLLRCQQTAEPIRALHPEAPFTLDARLRERKAGDFEGKHYKEADEHASGDTYETKKFPGDSESWLDVKKRMPPILNELLERYGPDDTVLLIAHGGPVRSVRSLISGKSLEEVDKEGTPNAGIWRFELTAPVSA